MDDERSSMHVLFAAPELAPFSADGELGELAGSLARGLRELGVQITILTPFYGGIDADRFGLARRIRKVPVPMGQGQEEVDLLDGKLASADIDVIFVDHPKTFQRDGLYGDASGPYADNHRRFYLFCRAILSIADELGLHADVVHAFDWQSGMLPLMLRKDPAAGSLAPAKILFSVYDANQLGVFDRSILDDLPLDHGLFSPDGIEFFGQVSLLKAGLIYSDGASAASPSYAREIRTEAFGGGLHGLYTAMGERLHGVLPGIDIGSWNPATDHRIAERYTSDDLSGKAACKRALQAELKLPLRPQLPLVAFFAPFTESRGFELLVETLEHLPQNQLQLAFVGPAGPAEQRLQQLTAEHAAMVAHRSELDIDATHRTLAGADAVLIPARYEPGGQLQLKALRYGAVPVVRGVGGLMDSVVDFDTQTATGTGIRLGDFDVDNVLSSLYRLLALHGDQRIWSALTCNCMRQTFDLRQTAQRYLEIYQGLGG
jgi:starch synthase